MAKKRMASTIAPQVNLCELKNLQGTNKHLPMLHGKATDSIATMAGCTIEENKLNNTGIIDNGEVRLVLDKLSELKGGLGVSTHKLLCTGIAELTRINHTGEKTRKINTTTINIPLKDYALLCGENVIEAVKDNPEDQRIEKERVKNALKNVRRKVKKDLEFIYSASLSWKEKERKKGQDRDFADIRIIEAKAIKNGIITMVFSQIFSEYLIQLPITQYPLALLRLDERNSTAYNIAYKMSQHYNMDNNHRRGTAQLLKVKTLLAVTSLPSADNSTVKRVGWDNRIKEPFENALDALTKVGFLEDWRYSHSKGEEMSDTEATAFNSYNQWAETLINFTIKDKIDHTARLENKTATRENKKGAKQ